MNEVCKYKKVIHPIKKRPIIIIASAVLVIIAGIIFARVLLNMPTVSTSTSQPSSPTESTNNLNNVDYNAPSDEQKNAALDTNPKNPAQSESPAQPTNTVTVEITAAVQDGTKLQLRALISELTATGTCTLRLTNTGQQDVVMVVGIQALSSTSTCKGFDVDTSNLSKGTWTATISVTAGSLTGTATKEVSIQ